MANKHKNLKQLKSGELLLPEAVVNNSATFSFFPHHFDKRSKTVRTFMGKGGLEPPRLAAHDPKSCLSANSSTSPENRKIISERRMGVNKQPRHFDIIMRACKTMLPIWRISH
jgi:hypothetical protein